ncbi:MAG: ADP-ribosylglycohydrolase family protein [Chloroflexota bacterium]
MTRTTDRRLGILLGKAVGDALGCGTEFQTPEQIRERYGVVDGYVQGVNHGFAPGEFTDDTQMALCTLGGYWDMQLRGEPLLDATLRRFQEWRAARPPDIGNATQSSLLASRRHGLAGGFVGWEQSGYSAAGNGALMRAAASVVAGRRGDALRREAIELAMLTHPDPRSLGACWLLVVVLEALLAGAEPADAWRAALDEGRRLRPQQVVSPQFGSHRAALVQERMPEATAALTSAVEHGLTGAWRSQSGYVIDTLEAVVAASLAPSFIDGILPIVARGDDSDTVAAIAGALLAARGLLPPDHLIDQLQCRFTWPTWPPGETRGWPTLAAFVPLREDVVAPPSTDPDEEADALGYQIPVLRVFTVDEIAPNVLAGRAPIFRRNVWHLRERGVTHILDLREDLEWDGPGRRGSSAIAEIDALGMVRLKVAIRDMGTPTPEDIDQSVAFMDAALHLGGRVYVHCRAGVQRTGAIAAAWYANQQGCSVDEAIARLRERRPDLEPMVFQVMAAKRWLADRKKS